MQEIVPVRVNLDLGNNLKLYVLSDTHIGDSHANINDLKKIINFIKDTPECYCILLGDILNTALKNSKSDIYSETLSVAESQKLALELLMPIKDKIIAMTPGNHENRVWREVGVDLSLWLAEKLGVQDKYRNNGIALTIQFGSYNNGRPYRLNIFGQHGSRGGRKLGSSMNALEDMDNIISNADIYIMGHTHQNLQGARKVFTFNENGNISYQNKYYYNSPSVMAYGGYAYDKGYKPSDATPTYLNIVPQCYRDGSKLVRYFKIDKIML